MQWAAYERQHACRDGAGRPRPDPFIASAYHDFLVMPLCLERARQFFDRRRG